MKYGDIVAILFVIMALYYVALIAMDLYKAKMTRESEKEKEKETEIDISDEVEGFKTIHVSREYPNGRLEAEEKDEAESKEENEGKDDKKENVDAHSLPGTPSKPIDPTKPKNEAKIPESQLQAIRRIKNRSEERIHHHKMEHQSKESPQQDSSQDVVADSQLETQDVLVEHEVRKTDPATRPGFRPPNMLGGMSVEEVVRKARRRSMGDDKAMAGIIHTCEAA